MHFEKGNPVELVGDKVKIYIMLATNLLLLLAIFRRAERLHDARSSARGVD